LRDNDVCAVMWADWYGFKMEAYDAVKENIPLVTMLGPALSSTRTTPITSSA